MQTVADSHNLNARLLRFRSDAEQEDPCALAEDLIAAQRYGDARGVAVSAQTDDGPLDARLLVIEGRAWLLDRDLVRSQAALVKAAKRDPGSFEAYRWLGQVLLERGDAVRAERALERAEAIAAGDPEVARMLALAHGRVQAMSTPPPPMAPLPSLPPLPPPVVTAPAVPRAVAVAAPVPAPVPAPAPGPVAPPAAALLPPPKLPRTEPGMRTGAGLVDAVPPIRTPDREDDTTDSFRHEPEFDDMSDGALDAEPADSLAGAPVEPWTVTEPGTRASYITSSAGRLPAPPATGVRPSTAGGLAAPAAPAARSSAGAWPASTASAPGSLGAATTPLGLGAPSVPGTRTAPVSAAGLPSPMPPRSVPGTLPSLRAPSASGNPSPLSSHPSAAGTSSPGSLASSSSSPGRIPSLAGAPAPRASSSSSVGLSSSGAFSAPTRADDSVEVELDHDTDADADTPLPAASEVAVDTTPGVGAAPASPPLPVPPAGMWDGSSVMAAWPSEDGLKSEPPPPPAHPDADASVVPAPDLALGQRAGAADDPEHVVAMLKSHGLIEPTQAEPTVWPTRAEVPKTGTRVRGAMTAVWLTTLVLCAGGWFGWQQWVAHRHAEAHALVTQARSAAWNGDYSTLLDAERALRKARELHPRSTEVPTLELFVQAVRVVENGSREPSGLRAALARADKLGADAAYVSVARALLAAYTGAAAELATRLPPAQQAAGAAPELAYLVGRLEQRLGQAQGRERLQAAATAAPELVPAALALAEDDHEQADDQAALGRLDAVLARHRDHLRAQLFRAVLRADADDPAEALKRLDALSERARAAAPVDRILWALARARVLRRTGDATAAGSALRDALAAGTSEAGLLALVAQEALRTGELGSAQQAASGAVAVAPGVITYRVLLARVLLARGDGQRVLELTSTLDPGAPELLAMRARAALQTGQRDALGAALFALPEPKADGGLELNALRLRLRAALEPAPRLLSEAQALLRRAPGDPEALRAVAEVALALRAANEAKAAAEQLCKLLPDDPEAHHWLGRARRMAGDSAGAEESLRRALTLSPGFGSALSSLATLLIDTGKYAEADAVYQELATRQIVTGRVGRAEALLGLGRAQDAAVQLSGLSDAQRALPAVREIEARVLLVQGKPGDALTVLRPLLEAEPVRPSALVLQGAALYAIDEVDASAGAYDAALEQDAELPEALLGRAEVHLRAERAKDALELLVRAGEALQARLRPPALHARYLTLLGRAHVQRGKREDLEPAKEALRRAVQLPSAPTEAFFWLGEALGGRKTPEAAAALKHYLELDPNGAYAARAKRALGPLL